jgi:hypothetical protein
MKGGRKNPEALTAQHLALLGQVGRQPARPMNVMPPRAGAMGAMPGLFGLLPQSQQRPMVQPTSFQPLPMQLQGGLLGRLLQGRQP